MRTNAVKTSPPAKTQGKRPRLPRCASSGSFSQIALADSLEEDDAGSDGDVERLNRAGCGQRNDEVASLARQFVQALAFAAENDAHRSGVIHFRVRLVRAFIESHEPVASFFQCFHRADEI